MQKRNYISVLIAIINISLFLIICSCHTMANRKLSFVDECFGSEEVYQTITNYQNVVIYKLSNEYWRIYFDDEQKIKHYPIVENIKEYNNLNLKKLIALLTTKPTEEKRGAYGIGAIGFNYMITFMDYPKRIDLLLNNKVGIIFVLKNGEIQGGRWLFGNDLNKYHMYIEHLFN
jgi:hypothetical protein